MTSEQIRKAALEEAAKICEDISRRWTEVGDARNACVVNACVIRIRERMDSIDG